MLIAACVCFILAIAMVFYAYRGTQPTLNLVAKVFFYFFLAAFFALIVSHIVNTAPPIYPSNEDNRIL